MTSMDHPVRRKSVHPYRVTLSGSHRDTSGRHLVIELRGDGSGDRIRIRESGRRKWIELDAAELYRRALVSISKRG